MKLGSIIQVRSFCDYIVKVPIDSGNGYVPVSGIRTGTYVAIQSTPGMVVGIVTDVIHSIKEDYLPYLPEEKQEVFLPYVTDFRSSYLIIKGIGNVTGNVNSHDLSFAPGINDPVRMMDDREIRDFHYNGNGSPGFSYYRRLSASIDPAVVSATIDRLIQSMPECKSMLMALKNYTEYK